MLHEVTREQVAASTDEIITKKRDPSKGQITTVARGSLPTYFVTPGKTKDATTNIEDNAPSSGRLDNEEVSRRSVAGCDAEHY